MKKNVNIFIICKRFWILILVFFALSALINGSVFANSYTKPRIIVTTDITNEPDDQQSLIRLLVYANNYDIEGLIGSTGIWKLSDPATEVIHECINAYGQVRGNLIQHDKDFPTEEYLHDIKEK